MDLKSRLKSWMLGPKAENAEVFEKLLLEAFRDYCYWRRNFHPEDEPWVGVEDRLHPQFQDYFQTLHNHLFSMLSHLKRSVPFFSPRYLGHMNTDLLMSGVIGYIAAMLYNQNNIVQEAATVTLHFETEAMRLVAEMLGLPVESSWGHLCSGGTSANMESLWVARNLRLVPYQIALAMKSDDLPGKCAEMLGNLEVKKAQTFGDLVNNQAIHGLRICDIVELHGSLRNLCANNSDLARYVEHHSPGFLGLSNFMRSCQELLGDNFPKEFRILVSRNAHYSVRKSVGVIGLGEGNIIPLPLDRQMRMDIKALEETLAKCYERKEIVMAVVGVYGSTEEGSVDDFAHILALRREYQTAMKRDFWLHSDACYGGYSVAMARPKIDAESLCNYMKSLLPSELSGEFVWDEEKSEEWLNTVAGLSMCDSISIDPHKLGYIPYPAGAVLYRDARVREVIRCDAPYINAAPAAVEDNWKTPYLGKYTLEGSRPGAYGAALWLAHKTVPLNQSGHGAIVAQSINGARYLQSVLRKKLQIEEEKDSIGCAFLCDNPDLNILCYTFPSRYEGQLVSLAVLNRAIHQFYDECLPTEKSPTQVKEFVVATTSLHMQEYGALLQDIISELPIRGRVVTKEGASNPWRDDSSISVVRTVVMGPFLIGSKTHQRVYDQFNDLSQEYVEFLRKSFLRIIGNILDSPIPIDNRPFLAENVLVLEDNIETRGDLCKQLEEISFVGAEKVFGAADRQTGLEFVKQNNIQSALVDIDLGPREHDGGIKFLNEMVKNVNFKGAVVFTSLENIQEKIKQIAQKRRDWVITFHKKPSRLEGRFQAACNRVMEDLWDILNQPRKVI